MTMTSFDIRLDTYADIAVSVASQGRRYRERQSLVSLSPRTELEGKNGDSLTSEWRERIRPWLIQNPDGGERFERCETLQDFEFHIFFLQHPISAMYLWNTMQEFYELDRVVCGTSKDSEEKISEWESMGTFKYLKSKKVERKWRSSLQNLKDITETKQKMHSSLQLALAKQNEKARSISVDTSTQTESQILSIQYGVDTLAEAWEELQRNFMENFKTRNTTKIVKIMLSEIELAVERRFSMLDISLKFNRGVDGVGGVDTQGILFSVLHVKLSDSCVFCS